MRVRVMFVSDLVKEVDLVTVEEEGGSNAMHGCVPPSLNQNRSSAVDLLHPSNTGAVPRNRTLPESLDTRRRRYKQGRARTPYQRFQSWTRLSSGEHRTSNSL